MSADDLYINFDRRQEVYLQEFRERADVLGTDRAVDRWQKTAILAEITRCGSMIEMLRDLPHTSSTLASFLGMFYWFASDVGDELKARPSHASQLFECVMPTLFFFGPEQYRILFLSEHKLHACIYTRLHPTEASQAYDRFVDEWIRSQHPNWSTEIVWDLAIVRDDTPFSAVPQ